MLAEIITASKKMIPVKLSPSLDGRAIVVDFVPTEIGENQLVVKVGGAPVPKTPQKFSVVPNSDPSKVVVSGPGLTNGEIGVPAKFRIDSRKAGVAPLGLNIDGPGVSLFVILSAFRNLVDSGRGNHRRRVADVKTLFSSQQLLF